MTAAPAILIALVWGIVIYLWHLDMTTDYLPRGIGMAVPFVAGLATAAIVSLN